MGPYVNYDPNKDPYVRDAERAASAITYNPDMNIMQDLIRHTDTTIRNLAAMTVGLPGDLQEMRNYLTGAPKGKPTLPTSMDVAEDIGGDPEHPSWLPAALVAPGPGEFKAALATLKGLGAGSSGVSLAQALFHGTPHKFDLPSNVHMGTGEGAQAYGWGHYVAEVKEVGDSYRVGVTGSRRPIRADNVERLVDQEGSEKAAMEYLRRRLNENIKSKNYPQIEKYKEEIAILQDGSYKGHIYEYDIPDEEIAKMLDWDAPLSEQPESVRKALRELDIEDFSYGEKDGGEIYEALTFRADAKARGGRIKMGQNPSANTAAQEEASKALNEAGIPGIKYFDGSSRSAQEGTRNMVLFEPEKVIKSVKRDSELVFEKSKLEKAMELVDKY